MQEAMQTILTLLKRLYEARHEMDAGFNICKIDKTLLAGSAWEALASAARP
jgi:hypothetical protein